MKVYTNLLKILSCFILTMRNVNVAVVAVAALIGVLY